MTAKYLEQLRQLVLAELGDTKVRLYLFGSFARGENRHSSDIDIAIDLEEYNNATAYKIAMIRERVAESAIPYNVDVIDLQNVTPSLRKAIESEGILWNS